ncbi:hypothetical protein OROGR_006362 [Orobanche gracilis]
MAPKKTSQEPNQEKRKDKEPETSGAQELPLVAPRDPARFQRTRYYKLYLKWSVKKILTEKRVELKEGDYDEMLIEIERRGWAILSQPPGTYNEDVVREFYANIDPSFERRQSWVRGVIVPFDRDTIHDYLGRPQFLSDTAAIDFNRLRSTGLFQEQDIQAEMTQLLCRPGHTFFNNTLGVPKRLYRKDMKPLTQAWTAFILHNVHPNSHTSDLTMGPAYLAWCIINHIDIDIADILSLEIHNIYNAKSIATPLALPGLITGLCQYVGVVIPPKPHKKLRDPINEAYIKKYCRIGDAEAPIPPQMPAAAFPDPQVDNFRLMQMMEAQHRGMTMQKEAQYLFTQQLNAAFAHISSQQGGSPPAPLTWSTPEAFSAHVAWPEDRPAEPEGMDADAAADGDDAGDTDAPDVDAQPDPVDDIDFDG